MGSNIPSDEFALRDAWIEKARAQTMESLPAFMEELAAHKHDYSSICYAVASAAVAAANALNRSPHGGITGFQAGAVWWEFLRGWDSSMRDKPLRLLRYENLLYPQYDRDTLELTKETWAWLQAQARKYLAKTPQAHPNIIERWRSIERGEIPCGFRVGRN